MKGKKEERAEGRIDNRKGEKKVGQTEGREKERSN